MSEDCSCVATLVHGTFARGAAWMDGALTAAVRSCHSGLIVEKFNWSGLNSHRARLAAGNELQEHILRCAVQYSGVPQLVIAHSHGGTVAAYALRDSKVQACVTGVICLGTPFVGCNPRRVERMVDLVRLLLLPLFTTLLYLGLFLGIEAGFAIDFGFEYLLRFKFGLKTDVPLFSDALQVVMVGIFEVAVFKLFLRLSRWVKQRIEDWALPARDRIVKRFEIFQNSAIPFLCVSTNLDEAGLWLRFSSRLAEVPFRLWSFTLSWCRAILAATVVFEIVTVGLGLLFEPAIIGPHPYPEEPPVASYGGYAAGAVLFAVAPLAVLVVSSLLGMTVVPLFTHAHPLAFGGESLSDNLLANISAAPVPASGKITRAGLEVPLGFFWRRTRWPPFRLPIIRLRHSALYDDPRCQSIITAWISNLLGATRSANQC